MLMPNIAKEIASHEIGGLAKSSGRRFAVLAGTGFAVVVLLISVIAQAARTGVMGQPVESMKDQYAGAAVSCPNNTFLAGFSAYKSRSISGL